MSLTQGGPVCVVPNCQRPAWLHSDKCDFHRPKKPPEWAPSVETALRVYARQQAEKTLGVQHHE